ncbi:hypothetical protein LTS07_010114 [Exophiala sideris]|uniref:Haloacid dehalogenase, type II n=1 Tax=Exophiala sideris TaxID=1016849 RepID=A0ABR0IXQ8_9EURO|nr:hypothetical protein LTS07_010114 [Exophiala sideris]KAK5027187.1 hypothetical protein LTR13_009582 [Exophiala sideris]KAK5051308.1 hypothetical protein LTR69_010334 [Exophiala sideris]KAK5177727.1 hypothetical protein LTR44_009702 [Eurotiomycetes sp. CCFEE 6388]
MSKLSDYSLLSFDVYGTLIDWETGILTALEPLTNQKDEMTRDTILEIYHELEKEQQVTTPDMPYSEVLAKIYPKIAERIGASAPSAQEAKTFGQSVGWWPAFPDTVDALKRLSKHYRLVVLSNVDKVSFNASNSGPLEGFDFDRIITAQEVGAYKPDLRNFKPHKVNFMIIIRPRKWASSLFGFRDMGPWAIEKKRFTTGGSQPWARWPMIWKKN